MSGTNVIKANPKNPISVALWDRAPEFTSLLPPGYPVSKLITGALVAVGINADLAKCSPVSIATSLARVAQWGLEVGKTAHLVPFGTKCEPIVDYKGYIEMMIAAGARKVEAHEVRDGDDFAYGHGTEPWLRHQPSRSQKPIVAAYAIVWLPKSQIQFEVLELADIEKRRAKSKQWNKGPLEPWYARKAAIRAIEKFIPKTSPAGQRLRLALEAEAEVEGFDPETGETTASIEGRIRAEKSQRLAEGSDYGVEQPAAQVKQGDAFEEPAA